MPDVCDSAVWVDLAPVTAPSAVAQTIADVLGLRESTGRSPLDSIVIQLRDRAALLVRDNCEHVVRACAEVATTITRDCPRVRVLATSREALGITQEQAWSVPPLASDEAARLFADRARRALPPFELNPANRAVVSNICNRLDCKPVGHKTGGSPSKCTRHKPNYRAAG